MLRGVFKQIEQHLFNQHGIHRNKHDVAGQLNMYGIVRIARPELHDHSIDQFIRYDRRLAQLDVSAVDARDRKQVLHHAGQPLGILLDADKDTAAFVLAEHFVFQQCGGGGIDGGQRRAQVMRHGAQQIGAHTLAFGFDLFRFALPELHGQRACQHSDDNQQRGGDQILRQREVKRKVRKGKSVIDCKHGKKRRYDTVNIAVGQQ